MLQFCRSRVSVLGADYMNEQGGGGEVRRALPRTWGKETSHRATGSCHRRIKDTHTQSTAAALSQPDNSEHGVEVLALSAVKGDLDEVLDGFHPLHSVGLLQDLCGHPEGLLVDHLLKLLQIATSRRGVQFKQVIHIPERHERTVKIVHLNK